MISRVTTATILAGAETGGQCRTNLSVDQSFQRFRPNPHLFAGTGDTRDPNWTDLQPANSDGQQPQQREEFEPLEDPFDLEPLEPLDPITEQNVLDPVRTEKPRPRLEDDEGWKSQRKPWLPDINTDIKSFEDIFGNVVDSYAEPRTSGGVSLRLLDLATLMVCSLLSVAAMQ